MSTLSTHVLDTATGSPAVGMSVSLHDGHGTPAQQVTTDEDGRARFDGELDGTVALRFETGAWATARGGTSFFPHVEVAVVLDPDRPHHHVPLLLSPFAYSTYRGS